MKITRTEYLFLLLLPQCKQRHTRDLDNLESDTTNITLRLSLLTEPSNQHLYSSDPSLTDNTVVLIDEIETTVVWHETRDPAISSLRQHGAYFFPFLMSWTRTHFRTAELGCLASIPIFSNTIPLPWEAPLRGDDFHAVPSARLRKCSSAHLFSRRWIRSLRAALRPAGFPLPMLAM
jgi:hypothetical protein